MTPRRLSVVQAGPPMRREGQPRAVEPGSEVYDRGAREDIQRQIERAQWETLLTRARLLGAWFLAGFIFAMYVLGFWKLMELVAAVTF